MNEALLLELARAAITTTLLVSAPILLTILVVGLLVSVLQAVTQVNEQTLVFIPKIVITFLILLFAGSWMGRQLATLATELFLLLPALRR
ncbi:MULTISPECIES: flagellar biosynthesis protein FliQ [Thermomicrobium]|jgi:flagellar biosynthetic protein FliQ|uniref:Flagellar biosynthetic protein FliQ n=1 Tax=Thermomicrobium roseum (strain ATCC 27502 / DSM 5159 / P-2) TaxID=309801 RepID=B9L5A8_THERP|nr:MULTISPECIES: flagellar biosynthesis protein FliQ [Thermomicrobium]ACM06538.1 flagellar biosynthetic protein FliQ [Thermomicrobium roseum DSM 5159]MBO9306820.1 flagellar biosynthesis protein FliQ [Thermomicrobium sp.]MBO9350904.1 flagellar biosynthesis protein FliQ [Thermomicrobium sp.]MBO9358533.1 flagellar biosynthesis protein FliQ [Thermomicrobium sp.]MBO9385070.1 flagellar biosynthesis protein FliQ [Thermomicrobium sp.]